MSDVAGLIFSDSYHNILDGLTERRALAAVPFGARYRIIDFVLSNMTNAGIVNIGIITTENYYSLMKHVGSGAPWDLNRKNAGVMFLPPFSSEQVQPVYDNRLESMQANINYLENIDEEYVLINGNGHITNMDVEELIQFHKDHGADITGVYTRSPRNKKEDRDNLEFLIGENQQLVDVKITKGMIEGMGLGLNVYVMNRKELLEILERTKREGKKSFRRDVLQAGLGKLKICAYETKGPVLFVDDASGYLKSSLDLLDYDIREAMFHQVNRPIITQVKDSAPTRYGKDAKAHNSLIADGVVVEGEVRNSIVFRGARIKKGAIVENSVVMQDVTIGEGAHLNYCILDKYSIINDGRLLSGYITHPFYVSHRTVI